MRVDLSRRQVPDELWELTAPLLPRFTSPVYPGHGDDTTLGAERPHLPEWHARGW
ncbi:hypothetical protein [Streptomyces sp. NBC_01538]|uniref:hypothetical protein n=1 Tax=Streptomyces sp. NBC_01538 TaxID=2903897 RepID=UPI003868A677